MAHRARTLGIKRAAATAAFACGGLLWGLWRVWPAPPPQRATDAATSVQRSATVTSASVEPQPRRGPAPVLPAAAESAAALVPAGLSVRGWVLDALGGPIVGAAVAARLPGGTASGSAVSEADGKFTLGVASASIELCAELDGYSVDCIHTAAPSDGNTLRLLPASSIAGRVVMADGAAAVRDATVEARGLVGSRSIVRSSRTNEHGAFSIPALPAASYTLAAISPRARSQEAHVALGIGEAFEVVLLSTPAVQVSAEVLVAGVPCRSGRVRLSGHLFIEGELTTEGTAVMSGVVPGQYTPVVTCEGAVTSRARAIEVGYEPVHHVWHLDPLPRSERPASAPPADASRATIVAQVRLEGDLPSDLHVFADTPALPGEQARREGARFVFDALPLGEYRVYAQDRLEEAVPAKLTRAGETVTVELRLGPGVPITGVVVDEHGAPVADAWVSGARMDASTAYDDAPVLTDMEGRFSLVGAKNAPYRLMVSSPSGDAVVEGVQGGNVVVRVARPASVSGTVWAREHGLVREFTVELTPRRGRETHEVRGLDSRFVVPAVQPGEYALTLRSAAGNVSRTLVVAPGQELSLQLTLDCEQLDHGCE